MNRPHLAVFQFSWFLIELTLVCVIAKISNFLNRIKKNGPDFFDGVEPCIICLPFLCADNSPVFFFFTCSLRSKSEIVFAHNIMPDAGEPRFTRFTNVPGRRDGKRIFERRPDRTVFVCYGFRFRVGFFSFPPLLSLKFLFKRDTLTMRVPVTCTNTRNGR